jgi:ADP-heptose:LPS heptosyltransferase
MSGRQNKKILVLGHSNIGDVCYDLVVVSVLRREFPDARISFFTSSRARNIVEGYGGLDEIVSFEPRVKGKMRMSRLRLMGRLIQTRFDLAVVLKKTLMGRFLGIPRCWDVNRYRKRQQWTRQSHAVDVYLHFLRSHGISAGEASYDYGFTEDENRYAENFFIDHGIAPGEKVAAILPAAAWSHKCWPIEKWNRLAAVLKERFALRVIQLSRRGDDDLSREIFRRISPEIFSADQTTLKQAMAIIKKCAVFIGPDSSLLHLASCLKTETIGLYGATSAECFYPYFHRENIVTPRDRMDCMPCYPGMKTFSCQSRPYFGLCMEQITVEDVVERVQQRLRL